jgi:hypothetical protein|tara:strand:+ start:45 stop:233 length:189 start_codon:yes stop_codon:yes gene_type:complete
MTDSLEINYTELKLLIEVVHSDIQMSSFDELDFEDAELMQYYVDRATVLQKMNRLIYEADAE